MSQKGRYWAMALAAAAAGGATPWAMLLAAALADPAQAPTLSRIPILISALAACAAALLVLRRLDTPARSVLARLAAVKDPSLAFAVLGAIVLEWTVGGGVLQGFWIIDDQYAVAMQAETFASGHLYAPAPPVPQAFDHPHFHIVGDIWVSQYPPGLALILTPLAWADAPLWLAPGLFAGGCLALFWRLARRRLGRGASLLAAMAFGGSAFFVLNGSMIFPHIVTTFFGLAAFECALRARSNPIWALVAGACIGAMGLVRPFNAVIFIAVIVMALATEGHWRTRLLRLAVFGAAGAPVAIGLLVYNLNVTGSPLTNVTEFVGMHEPIGAINLRSLVLTARRAADLAFTTSPVLSAAALVSPLVLWRARSLQVGDLVFPATFAAFLFYAGDGGRTYGPRYLFEAYPFIVLSAAAALSHVRFAHALVAVHFSFQLAALPSWLAVEGYANWTTREPYRLAAAGDLSQAIVILKSPAGAYRSLSPSVLARNGMDLHRQSVIYAVDIGDGGASLMRAFPGRSLWIYRDGTLVPAGRGAPRR